MTEQWQFVTEELPGVVQKKTAKPVELTGSRNTKNRSTTIQKSEDSLADEERNAPVLSCRIM